MKANLIYLLNIEPLPEIKVIPNNLPVFDMLQNETDYFSSLVCIKYFLIFSVNYFLGTNPFQNSKYYHGFQLGVSLPIFHGSFKAKINATKLASNAKQLSNENQQILINNQLSQLISEQVKYKALIDNYKISSEPLINTIIKTAIKSHELGEINFYEFVNSIETAIQLKLEYLDNFIKYNQAVVEIKYFSK